MNSTQTQKLFTAVQVGAGVLDHRVVMAALTRLRSQQPGEVHNDLIVEYVQRSPKLVS